MITTEIEVALMRYFDFRANTIVPNLSESMLPYEADVVVVTKSGYATEIEIKVSKSDLMADFKKKRFHDSKLFKRFYYAVPEELKEFALSVIPESAGLLVATRLDDGDVIMLKERNAEVRRFHKKWEPWRIADLQRLGTMRIFSLKQKILTLERKINEG